MVTVPIAVAILWGPQRSRLLLPGALGLFPFPSAPTAGLVHLGLVHNQRLPPEAASAAGAGMPFWFTLSTCCCPLAGTGGLPVEYGGLPPTDLLLAPPPRPIWLTGISPHPRPSSSSLITYMKIVVRNHLDWEGYYSRGQNPPPPNFLPSPHVVLRLLAGRSDWHLDK